MAKLLEHLGFTQNPFSTYVAENEPDIEHYFVQPPYYTAVTERGRASQSMVLFGARGAGKSATRLAFFKQMWAQQADSAHVPLVVVLDDFTRVVGEETSNLDLGNFVLELGYLTVEAVLVWLAALPDDERLLIVETLTQEEESLAVALVQRFYLTRAEFVRSTTAVAPMKLLNQAWHRRTKLWMSGKWDAVIKIMTGLAQALANKAADTQLQVEDGVRELLKAGAPAWREAQFAKAVLAKLAAFAKAFGFTGVTVLVDKVDETQWTSNSAASTAKLLYPVLSSTQLMEIQSFGWLLFMWDRVREEWSGEKTPVRLDKIAEASIQWDTEFLQQLVARRIEFYSSKRLTRFADLCDPEVDATEVLAALIQTAMRSPREIIRVLDTVIREHDEQFSGHTTPPRLVQESIDRALDKYSAETVLRLYSRVHIQQIARVGSLTFTNKEVQSVFRINEQSARNRIRNWVDTGAVAHTGSRAAEGGQGGKPQNEYSIVDYRLRRIVERNVSLGIDYELADAVEESGHD